MLLEPGFDMQQALRHGPQSCSPKACFFSDAVKRFQGTNGMPLLRPSGRPSAGRWAVCEVFPRSAWERCLSVLLVWKLGVARGANNKKRKKRVGPEIVKFGLLPGPTRARMGLGKGPDRGPARCAPIFSPVDQG